MMGEVPGYVEYVRDALKRGGFEARPASQVGDMWFISLGGGVRPSVGMSESRVSIMRAPAAGESRPPAILVVNLSDPEFEFKLVVAVRELLPRE